MSRSRRRRLRWRRVVAVLGRAAAFLARQVLSALPPHWLPALARALAGVRLVLDRGARGVAAENLALALGVLPTSAARRVLIEGDALRIESLLRTLHRRDPTLAELAIALAGAPFRGAPTLLLGAHLGGAPLVMALLREAGPHWAFLDAVPQRREDAVWLPWLGRMTALDAAPVRAALARGAGVRLILVLPAEVGRFGLWWSPDLAAGVLGDAESTAREVLRRALGALEILVRAAPGLCDWTWPRWSLRPEERVAGHARRSRLAPWLGRRPVRAPRRARPRGRRAR